MWECILALALRLRGQQVLRMSLGRENQMSHFAIDPFNKLPVALRRIVREDFLLNASPEVFHRCMRLIARVIRR